MHAGMACFVAIALLLGWVVACTEAACEINSYTEPETVIRAGQLLSKSFDIDGSPVEQNYFCFASVRVMSTTATDILPHASLRGSQFSMSFIATQAGTYSIHADPLECGGVVLQSFLDQKKILPGLASLLYSQMIEYVADQSTVANLYVTWNGWIRLESTSKFVEISAYSRSGKSFVSLDGIPVIDCVTSWCLDPSLQRISYPSIYGTTIRIQVGFQVDSVHFDSAYFNLSWSSADLVGGIFNSSSICVSSQGLSKKLWTVIVQSSIACAASSYVQSLSTTTAWAGSQIIVRYQLRDAYSNAVEVDSTENSVVAWLQYAGSSGQDGPKIIQMGGKSVTLISPSDLGIIYCRVCLIGSGGLQATYYSQRAPVMSPIAAGIQASIDFSRGSNQLVSSLACPFYARWQGFIRAGSSSVRTFLLSTLAASNSLVYINIDGLLQLDSWFNFPAASSISGTFSMIQNNWYSVEMQYECFATSAATDFHVKLEWIHSNSPIEIVPFSNLIPIWDFNNSGITRNGFQVSVQSKTVCAATSACYGSGLTIATSGTKLQFSLNIRDEYGRSPSNIIESVVGTVTNESGLTFRLDANLVMLNSWIFSWTPTISGQYVVALTADYKSLCDPHSMRLIVQPGLISSGTSSAAVFSSIISAGQNVEFYIITKDAYGNKAVTPDCSNLMNIGLLTSRQGEKDSVYAASASLAPLDFSKVTLKSSIISASGMYRIDIFIMSTIITSLEVSVISSSRSRVVATGISPTTGVIGEIINFKYIGCLDEFGNSVSQAIIFASVTGPATVYATIIQPNCQEKTPAQATFKFNAIGTYSIFATSAIGTGFMATYYSSITITSAIASQSCPIPYLLRATGEREYPLLQADTDDGYSVRWKGFLRKYLSGVFTVAIRVANGASEKIVLFVDHIQVLNNNADFSKTELYSATLYFGDSTTYHEVLLEYARSAKISGISHSSFLAFGILDSVGNFVGMQSLDVFDVRHSCDSTTLGMVHSIVISSNGSALSSLSDIATFPVSLSNVSTMSVIEFKITPRDAFSSLLSTCASSVAFMRRSGILESVPVYAITEQGITKCRGFFSSLTTSGTFQLHIFASHNHPAATYYQDLFFNIPFKTSILSAPSLKWDDVSNPTDPGPIPFKMAWMAEINSSCITRIQCSSLISMSWNSLPIFPSTRSNFGQVVQIGRQYSWRPFFDEDRMVHFEIWGLMQPEGVISVQKLCFRNEFYSWGSLQHLIPISTLTMIVMADVSSASLCEVSALSGIFNLFVPIHAAIMKISCQRDQFGNIQSMKSLVVGTHFKKISSEGTEFGDGCSATLQSFHSNVWIISFVCAKSGRFGTVSGVVAAGSLAATFYDSEKQQNQQSALNTSAWSMNLLSPFNLNSAPASTTMSFGGFLAWQAGVTPAFQVSVQDAGSATFNLWLDGKLSISATVLAGSNATGLFSGSNFIRETTSTGESLIPIQFICTTTHYSTKLMLLWNVSGSFVSIPASKMYSLIYSMEPPNVLQTFEAKANHQDDFMSCSSSGTGLSIMTVGLFSTFSVFCKDGMGRTLDASAFVSQIRCSLLNVHPSFDTFYSSPCLFQSMDNSVLISLKPSSMHQKLMLSIFGDYGFWATYYSSTDWTNPVASRIEPTVDFSHLAGSGPSTSLTAEYSIRWRGFCSMPSSGPLTMSFLKSAGSHALVTDRRALLNSEATAVQMELFYSLNASSNTNFNIIKLEWAGYNHVASKVSSLLMFVLEDSQPMSIFPGFCSLKTFLISGSTFATIGSQQSLNLTLKDAFENSQCSLSNIAIVAYAIGQTNQVPMFEQKSQLHVAWREADLYDVKLVLGKSFSGPEMNLYQDASCSILIHKKTLQIVDFDPTGLEKGARCLRIEGLIELSAATTYAIQSHVDTSHSLIGVEPPCTINLTVFGVGSNLSRDDTSLKSSISSSIFLTTYMPGFVHFSLIYTHAPNCNRLKLTLASSLNDLSYFRSVYVDSSNSGMLLESIDNTMRINVAINSYSSRINIETMLFPQESFLRVGISLVESFTFSCRDENHVGSLCGVHEFYAATCPKTKGRRCIQPTGLAFDSSQTASFKSVITIASAYKQSLAITTEFGVWATYYEDSFFSSPYLSFVEPVLLPSSEFKLDLNTPFLPISSGFSAKWAGLIRSNLDSVTTITSNSLAQGDSLTVWTDNFLVFDQRKIASQSGTITLQSNSFFDIEIEYQHFGMGLGNMEIAFSAGKLHFLSQNKSNIFTLNSNSSMPSICKLVATNAPVSFVTFGIPVTFYLFCEDQFSNSISQTSDITTLVFSQDNPVSNPSYSHNSFFTNGLIAVSSVFYCCVSKFYFRVSVDNSMFISLSYEAHLSPPVEALMLGPSILTSGIPAVFTIYPRDIFNGSAVYGNAIKMYLSHIIISFTNFTSLDKMTYSIDSAYSIAADSQTMQLRAYLSHDSLLIHHHICKSGYLVKIFSSDLNTKASLIYEFVLSSVRDFNIYLYVSLLVYQLLLVTSIQVCT
jgi:hypothetical protein